MAWKRLTFVLIPHSKENIKQINVHRKTLYALVLFLITSIGIMIFYIIGFKGKSFYQNRTKNFEQKNQVLQKHLSFFDSSLASMSLNIAHLESINTRIMEESDIPDRDLKLTNFLEIDISKDGIMQPPQRVLAIIDRMDRESAVFEQNFATLFEYCMSNIDFVKHVPSIRPTDGVISREFGRSFDKYSQTEKTYPGVDIHNVEGTPVVATADGIVEQIDISEELGRYIVIDHQNGYKTRYAHLQTKTIVNKGNNVIRGQQIGTIGTTGFTIQVITAHIMYSVYHHGIPVNPADYFFASDFSALPLEGSFSSPE